MKNKQNKNIISQPASQPAMLPVRHQETAIFLAQERQSKMSSIRNFLILATS